MLLLFFFFISILTDRESLIKPQIIITEKILAFPVFPLDPARTQITGPTTGDFPWKIRGRRTGSKRETMGQDDDISWGSVANANDASRTTERNRSEQLTTDGAILREGNIASRRDIHPHHVLYPSPPPAPYHGQPDQQFGGKREDGFG